LIVIAGFALLVVSASSAQQPVKDDGSSLKACVGVYGAVRSPGRFETQRWLRLAEAIEMSGGATDKASGKVLVIHEGYPCGPIKGRICIDCIWPLPPPLQMDFYKLPELGGENEKANSYLNPRDIVLVVEVDPVYVTGYVVAPQGLPFRDQMTLTKAIALAGGEPPYADIAKVKIYRTNIENSARSEFTFDLKAIRKGRAEDPILQAFDIIEIPYAKKWRSWTSHRPIPGPTIFDSGPFPKRPDISPLGKK